MMELHVRYEDGKFELPPSLEPSRLKDARVKVVVTVAKGPHESLSHEAQNELREKILAGNPSEVADQLERQFDIFAATPVPPAALIAEGYVPLPACSAKMIVQSCAASHGPTS